MIVWVENSTLPTQRGMSYERHENKRTTGHDNQAGTSTDIGKD